MDFDKSTIPDNYRAGRKISGAKLALWMDAVERHIDTSQIESILDVGCGTGRFSEGLAERFDAHLVGVDPSTRMREQVIESLPGERYDFKAGSAEQLPMADASVDLIFLSMVWHHIGDVDRALREFRRVLRNGAFVCVRNSTVEKLDHFPYLKYFPAARALDMKVLPAADKLKEDFAKHGFELITHDVIDSLLAENFRGLYEKMKLRALSDIARISDEDFEAGLKKMAADLERMPEQERILEPIDLFVFRMG